MEPLTEEEKKRTLAMAGISAPFNEKYFNSMNIKQINYLLSTIDMQDTMSSYSCASYVQKLTALQKQIQ